MPPPCVQRKAWLVDPVELLQPTITCPSELIASARLVEPPDRKPRLVMPVPCVQRNATQSAPSPVRLPPTTMLPSPLTPTAALEFLPARKPRPIMPPACVQRKTCWPTNVCPLMPATTEPSALTPCAAL